MVAVLLLGVAVAGVPTKLKPPEVRGERLYRAHCQGCHGTKGLGDGPASAVMRGAAPALAGRFGPKPSSEEIMSVLVGRGDMPGYGAAMGYEDARDILLWLGRLDPETGQHPGKKPPTLQTPPERPADKAPPGSPGQDTEASRAEPSPSQPG